MNTQSLIESLEAHRKAIRDEAIQELDFDQLEKDLNETTGALVFLAQREELCERLVTEFKSEIKKMALAVSRAKGGLGSCSLAERLLSSPDLAFEDLLFLKEKVRDEFNRSFPSSPQSRVMASVPESEFRTAEYKTGFSG